MMLVGWYTLVDVISPLLTTRGWIEDIQLPIRGPPGVEYIPISLSSATFHLEDIKQIKNSVGGVYYCSHHILAALIHVDRLTKLYSQLFYIVYRQSMVLQQ